MPDVLIYPKENGGKPVKVHWDSPDMPTDQDIEDMYSAYSKSNPQSIEPKPTGRIGSNPSRLGGTLTPGAVNPAGGFAPVVPGKTPGVANPMPNAPVNLPALALSGGNPGAIAGAITGKGSPPQPKMTQATKKAMTPSLPGSFQPSFVQRAQQAADISTQPINQAAQKVQKEVTKQKREAQLKTNQGFETEKGIPFQPQKLDIAGSEADVRARIANETGTDQKFAQQHTKDVQKQAADTFKAHYGVDINSPTGWIIQANDDTNRIGQDLKALVGPTLKFVGDYSPLGATLKPLGISLGDIAADQLPNLAAGLVNTPQSIVTDLGVVAHPDSTLEQRAGALANIILQAAGTDIAAPVLTPIKKYIGEFLKTGNFERFNQAVDSLSLEPNATAAFKQWASENPHLNAELKGFKEGKPVISIQPKEIPNARQVQSPTEVHGNVPEQPSQGKQAVPPQEGSPGIQQEAFGRIPEVKPQAQAEVAPQSGQGIAHGEIDDLRKEMGWSPREKTTKSDAQLFQDAQKYKGKESTLADQVLADKSGTLSDEASVALGVRLKNLKDEMTLAKKADNFTAYDLADTEAQKIADALDHSGSNQGRAFRARRFLLENEFDEWSFRRRVAKANADLPLDAKRQKAFEDQIAELTTANESLTKERDAAVSRLEGSLRSYRQTGAKTVTRNRAEALNALKRLGVQVSETPELVGTGMPSKQSGAINLPPVGKDLDQVAMNIRKLVKSYSGEGLDNWPKVLKRLQKDIPGIEEDQALYILSGEYKQAKLKADVSKIKATEFINAVKSEAEFRNKSAIQKLLSHGTDILNTSQRSLQTTLDNSMALIQGKNVLTWKPGTWFKGVGDSMKAFATKDPLGFARKHQAEIENHILYPEARQAKLALSSIDGPLNRQEEFFAGKLENHVPGLTHSKAAATVLMNKMRFDLFRKMAKNAPKDPQLRAQFFKDIAQQINIATGKGQGRIAEALGGKLGGTIAYAPRFTISKWQHSFGAPLFLAKTGAGRVEALKMYGSQIALYTGLVKAAQLFGGEVNTDPRSTDFGLVKFGDHTYDLFRTQTEGIRTAMQLIYGRTSKAGNYKSPTNYGAYSAADYLTSKGSPLFRTLEMLRSGGTWDDTTGERRAVQPSDFWQSYIPMSIKEMMKNKDWRTFLPSFMGGNVDTVPKQKEIKSPTPPFKAMPPGLDILIHGDPKEKEKARQKAFATAP